MTAELIDAATGAQVWSERWDRPAQDLFAVQAEVADKVAASLGGNGGSDLGAIQGRLLAEAKKRAPANLSAYDFWLLAREQSDLNTKAGEREGSRVHREGHRARSELRVCLRDAGMAQIAKVLGVRSPSGRRRSRNSKATCGWRWRSIRPTPGAHAGLIRYFADKGQWTELSAEIDRAVRDNPTNNLVLSDAAQQLPFLGRPEEGVAMADLVLRLDPQMPQARRGTLVAAYFFGRKFERAIEMS